MSRTVGSLVLAGVMVLGTTYAVERVIARWDVTYAAGRARPGDDRVLRSPEFSVRVVTNALGFREPRLPTPKPAGTSRVVVLGDSFAYGYGVDEPEAFPRRLEALLRERGPDRAWEVVNLAVPGTNPRDHRGNLVDVGFAYDPDVVIVATMANDVQDVLVQQRYGVRYYSELVDAVRNDVRNPPPLWKRLTTLVFPHVYELAWYALRGRPATAVAASPARDTETTRRPPDDDGAPLPETAWLPLLREFAARHGRAEATMQRLEALAPAERRAIGRLLTGALPHTTDAGMDAFRRLLALVNPSLRSDGVVLTPEYDEAWDAFAGYLREIHDVARSGGARTIVCFIPSIHQVTEAARPAFETLGFQWDPRTLIDRTFSERLAWLAADDGFELVDFLDDLRPRAGDPIYFPLDGHWTAAGHEIAARRLADTLLAGPSPGA